MADTIDAVEIPGTWTDVNALTNIIAGTEIQLQNVGGPNSIIELATSPTEPPLDFNGVRLGQNDPMPVLPAGESTLWARYIRMDRSDVGTRVTKLQVQPSGAGGAISQVGRNNNVNNVASVLAPVEINPTTSVTVLPANDQRMYVQINNNNSTRDCWIKLQPASQDNDQKGIFIHRRGGGNNTWEMPTYNIYTGEISAISEGGNADIYVTEY